MEAKVKKGEARNTLSKFDRFFIRLALVGGGLVVAFIVAVSILNTGFLPNWKSIRASQYDAFLPGIFNQQIFATDWKNYPGVMGGLSVILIAGILLALSAIVYVVVVLVKIKLQSRNRIR